LDGQRLAAGSSKRKGRTYEVGGMQASSQLNEYSILITDDDRNCREALRDIMEPQGFRTFLAACGEEALEITQAQPVHLAILDMHMPTLTGLETLCLLRQIRALLPCILVSADVTESLMRQAWQAHAYSVIPKPVSKNVVIHTVVRALIRVYGETSEEDRSIG
jgi:two-component system chemotaxis response regulator CheY